MPFGGFVHFKGFSLFIFIEIAVNPSNFAAIFGTENISNIAQRNAIRVSF